MAGSGRNFWAVLPSLFSTSLGLMAVLPTLTLYVEEHFQLRGADALRWSGAIYGIAPLTAGIAGPLWGALGDRLGKKPMAIRANLAIAVSTALMPLMPTPLWLLLLRAIQGLFAGYVAPAMSLVSAETPAEQQGRVIGWMQVGMATGSLLGPSLGAAVSTSFGLGALFYVTSALALLATLPLWLLAREVKQPRAGEVPTFLRELWTASTQMLHNRVFASLLLLVLLMRLGQNMLEPFIAVFVRELGPLPLLRTWTGDPKEALAWTVSLAWSVLAVAQVVFTPFWGRLSDRIGPLRCLTVVAIALALLLGLTAAVAGIGQFFLMRTLASVFMAGSMTLAYAAATKRVVAARHTLAFSMMQSCMQFAFAFGPMGGSWLAAIGASEEHPNLRLLFLIAGALCLLAGAGMIRLRRLPAGRAESAPPSLGESIGP